MSSCSAWPSRPQRPTHRLNESIRIVLLLVMILLPSCKPQTPADTPSQPVEQPTAQPHTQQETESDTPKETGLIVAMGNSLTAGLGLPEEEAYPAQLEALLRAKGHQFRVVNAGISGETSSGALSRTQWTLTLKPDIVILETGANDGLRGIPPDITQQNISAIVQQLQQQGVVVLLAGMRMVENLGEAYTTAFAMIYQTLSTTPDIIFMPFFLEGVAANPSLNQADGIHPTTAGYQHIVAALYPYVITAITQAQHPNHISKHGKLNLK